MAQLPQDKSDLYFSVPRAPQGEAPASAVPVASAAGPGAVATRVVPLAELRPPSLRSIVERLFAEGAGAMSRREYRAARTVFQRILDLAGPSSGPDSPALVVREAQLGVARIHIANEKWALAKRALEPLSGDAASADSVPVLLAMGQWALGAGPESAAVAATALVRANALLEPDATRALEALKHDAAAAAAASQPGAQLPDPIAALLDCRVQLARALLALGMAQRAADTLLRHVVCATMFPIASSAGFSVPP